MQQQTNFSLIQAILTQQITNQHQQICQLMIRNVQLNDSIAHIPIQVIVYLTFKINLTPHQQLLLLEIYNHIIISNHLNIDIKQLLAKRLEIKVNIYPESQIINLPNKKYVNIIIAGKAANIAPKFKQLNSYHSKEFSLNQINSDIEQIYRTHSQNFTKNHRYGIFHISLEDILLTSVHLKQYQMLSLETKVFNIIYTITKCIIFTFPIQLPRPKIIKLLKNSLLHVYMDQSQFLNEHTRKIQFNRNDVIKGINFIEQGVIEVTSGRLVARGWIINGIPQSSGICWRFQPISFFKYFIKNENVWNQFINDMKLNEAFPLKLDQILEINNDYKRNYTQRNMQYINPKNTQLPVILNGTIMQKIKDMKHWDSQFKKNSRIKKKILMSMYKPDKRLFIPLFGQSEEKTVTKPHRISLGNSISNMSSVVAEQKIFVNSVLNKLESMVQLPSKPSIKRRSNEKTQFTNLKLIKLLGPQSIYQLKNKRYPFRNN